MHIRSLLLLITLLMTGILHPGHFVAAAQNTACIGSAEFTANHQLAEQAVDTLIQQHQEIYTKDSSLLTDEDYQTVAQDVAFYATQLILIEAPLNVLPSLYSEVAMYMTLAAMLSTASSAPDTLTVDLSALYDDAGSSLAGALQSNVQALIASCPAYDGVYGKYLTTQG